MLESLYVGLMSGTSLDGVDCAVVDFASARPQVVATRCEPLPAGLRGELLALQSSTGNELERAALAANDLARGYARAVHAALAEAGATAAQVRAIGSHGQTVRHRPEAGFTIQLNNAALLAELTGITVVADFRSRDVAAGGQGAPLAPVFHREFFGSKGSRRAILNLGGIANVTLISPEGEVSGFDTGPANVLMDLWCARHRGQPFDEDGAWAASGQPDDALLTKLLAEPYFHRAPPKSTGRDLFHSGWLERNLREIEGDWPVRAADVQATLLELTAHTACASLEALAPSAIYVCGGGASNRALLRRIQALAGGTPVETTAALGVPPDWVEAIGFAWLAKQTLASAPASLPSVTGARGARVLGAVYPA